MIGAHEVCDRISADVPNTFIQTDIPNGNEWMIMKIPREMVDLLVKVDPETYGK